MPDTPVQREGSQHIGALDYIIDMLEGLSGIAQRNRIKNVALCIDLALLSSRDLKHDELPTARASNPRQHELDNRPPKENIR